MKNLGRFVLPLLCATAVGISSISTPPGWAASVCPETNLGETVLDCPWAGIARDIEKRNAKGADRWVIGLLTQALPALKISPSGTEFWGESINYDELAHGVIVHPSIIAALEVIFHQRDRVVTGRQIVHAGMEHTYGYLFSTLRTPYGYKRARWVQGEIEAGFGLPPGILGPKPFIQGNLFANVTYFAGSIAFRDQPELLQALHSSLTTYSPELTQFNYSALKPVRLEEQVQLGERIVTLRTDLVPFTLQSAAAGSGDSHLLVYSVSETNRLQPMKPARTVLITAFPVRSSFVSQITNPASLGELRPIVTRYNAYVEGVSGSEINGSRKIKP